MFIFLGWFKLSVKNNNSSTKFTESIGNALLKFNQ